MKYKFRAKSVKTGKWVEGNLAYATTLKTRINPVSKTKVFIVNHKCNGGLIYVTDRTLVDEDTVELIKEQ